MAGPAPKFRIVRLIKSEPYKLENNLESIKQIL
jgi:hypothetical protein